MIKIDKIKRLQHMILNNYLEILKIYIAEENLDVSDFISLCNFAEETGKFEFIDYFKWHLENLSKLNKGNRTINKLNKKGN